MVGEGGAVAAGELPRQRPLLRVGVGDGGDDRAGDEREVPDVLAPRSFPSR